MTHNQNQDVVTPSIIAIDGTAASGKGTLCRSLGDALNFAVLDTGKLYRYIGLEIAKAGIDTEDEYAVCSFAARVAPRITPAGLKDPALVADHAAELASRTSRYKALRQTLVDFQRNFAASPPAPYTGAILDGRDIGTVILPDAPIKFFVTADLQTRAQRRFDELSAHDADLAFETVLSEMQERDERDASRADAPMKAADDAVLLDTTHMDIAQVFDRALLEIKKKLDL